MSLYLFFLLHRRGESILHRMACSRINTNKQAHFKCCASAVLNSGDCVVLLDLACTVVYYLVVHQSLRCYMAVAQLGVKHCATALSNSNHRLWAWDCDYISKISTTCFLWFDIVYTDSFRQISIWFESEKIWSEAKSCYRWATHLQLSLSMVVSQHDHKVWNGLKPDIFSFTSMARCETLGACLLHKPSHWKFHE